jgi:hypothetical protein
MPPFPHQKRPLRYVETHQIDHWRIKTYTIALASQSARPELVSATLAQAKLILPTAAFEEGRHGVGFVIAHDAAVVCFGLIYWWQGDNELHQRLYMAPKDAPANLRPIEYPAAGCVWELGIIDFESRAWLADVLDNPSKPDLDLYLSRTLDTML